MTIPFSQTTSPIDTHSNISHMQLTPTRLTPLLQNRFSSHHFQLVVGEYWTLKRLLDDISHYIGYYMTFRMIKYSILPFPFQRTLCHYYLSKLSKPRDPREYDNNTPQATWIRIVQTKCAPTPAQRHRRNVNNLTVFYVHKFIASRHSDCRRTLYAMRK